MKYSIAVLALIGAVSAKAEPCEGTVEAVLYDNSDCTGDPLDD